MYGGRCNCGIISEAVKPGTPEDFENMHCKQFTVRVEGSLSYGICSFVFRGLCRYADSTLSFDPVFMNDAERAEKNEKLIF